MELELGMEKGSELELDSELGKEWGRPERGGQEREVLEGLRAHL